MNDPRVDFAIAALTAWREDRGAGAEGMTAVLCVIRNRVKKHKTSYYAECIKPLAFSSLTAHGDQELGLWPNDTDPSWQMAQMLADGVINGTLADITGGSTLYYAPKSIPPNATIALPDGSVINWPASWDRNAVKFFGSIGDQVYFLDK